MNFTDRFLRAIKEAEGFRSEAYRDGSGWSIGYGHWSKEKPITLITEMTALQLLIGDLNKCVAWLESRPWFSDLDSARQEVLLEMAFNLGLAGLLGFEKMIEAIENVDYMRAADEILDSKAARQAPYRYQRLAQSMRDGTLNHLS